MEKIQNFSDNIDHGFSYFPIIKIKNEHPLFGFSISLIPRC